MSDNTEEFNTNNTNEGNQVREFNLNITNNKKQQCKFFNTKMGCKNRNCSFLHITIDNWRNIIKTELSPEEQISEEVKLASKTNSMNDIFKKMCTSNDDYKKYYFEVEKIFRGIAVWKLEKISIEKNLINTIDSRNVEINIKLEDGSIDNGILPYGYIPLCLFFIFNGIAWKLFDGAPDSQTQRETESCLDEIIDIISKIYSKEEYKEIIKTMILYCNPESYATIGHISIGYLCDIVLIHIKSQLSLEEFEIFLNEKTKDDETCRNWLDWNIENNNEYILKRYKYKYDRSIQIAKNNIEKQAKAKKIYDFNILTFNKKINIINIEIFSKGERKRIIMKEIDVNQRFNDALNLLMGQENKFGRPYNQTIFTKLISLINHSFKDTVDEKIKLILEKIPANLFNGNQLIIQFKENDYITNLWKYTLSTISMKNPMSFCPPLLHEFFKESNNGIKEAYIGEYIHMTLSLIKDLSEENKLLFFESINTSSLSHYIKDYLINH